MKLICWTRDPKRTPPARVQIGNTPIPVPNAEEQRAGFYSEHADKLVRSIPGYKYLKRRRANS